MRRFAVTWVKVITFGIAGVACAPLAPEEPGDQRAANTVAATGELQNCGFVVVTADHPVTLRHPWRDTPLGEAQPGDFFPSSNGEFCGYRVPIIQNGQTVQACVSRDDVTSTCPSGVKARRHVALRDTHLITGLPLSTATARDCAIPTGTFLGFSGWGSGGDVPLGYLRVTLDEETLPGCASREGFVDTNDIREGAYYYGAATPELTRVNEARRAAGTRGQCEEPQVWIDGACSTKSVPVQCRQPSVLTAAGDNCAVPTAAERGFQVGGAVVVRDGRAAGWMRGTVVGVDGDQVTLRTMLMDGPYGYALTELSLVHTNVHRVVAQKGLLRAGETYVARDGSTLRIHQIEELTDLGWARIITKTIAGDLVDPNQDKEDLLPLADAERLVRDGATLVTTELHPGEVVAYTPAVLGMATVVEQRGQLVRIAYERTANGAIVREALDVARAEVTRMSRELDGVKTGEVYVSRARTTLVGRVDRIFPDGLVSVMELDALARTGSGRMVSIAAFKAAYVTQR